MLGVEPEENHQKSGFRQSFTRSRSPNSSKLLSEQLIPDEELRPLSLSSGSSPASGPLPEPQLCHSRGSSLTKDERKPNGVPHSETRSAPVVLRKVPEWDPEWGPPVRKGAAAKTEAQEWDPFFGPPVVRGTCLKVWESERGKPIAGVVGAGNPSGVRKPTFVPQRRDEDGVAMGGGAGQGVAASLLVQAGQPEREYGQVPPFTRAPPVGVRHTVFMGYQAPPPVTGLGTHPYPPQRPVAHPAPAKPLPAVPPATQHYKPLPTVPQTTSSNDGRDSSSATISVFTGYSINSTPAAPALGYSFANASGDPQVVDQEPTLKQQKRSGTTISDSDL
jgi:hypothetical protein